MIIIIMIASEYIIHTICDDVKERAVHEPFATHIIVMDYKTMPDIMLITTT
jgi:hypothetical protein